MGLTRVGDKVYSTNLMSDLTVAGVTNDGVYLSQDGQMFTTDVWATGTDDTGVTVYVEIDRTAVGARSFHGFVDATSRKLVQAG